jgi:hypothetical protein
MVHKTSDYYSQLSSTIPATAQKKWEEDEMKSAENRCLEDPTVMDIIGTQEVNVLTAESARQPDH